MNLNDLNSLKLAIDTGNHRFYPGNMDDALSELVDELIGVHATLGDAARFDVNSVSELAGLYKGTMARVAELEEDAKTNIMEINFSTCKISGVELGSGRIKKFENLDSEHPVIVTIKELT